MRLRDFLLMGIFWGIVAGFVECLKFLIDNTIVISSLFAVNEHSWWMAPAGNAIVFALVGGLMYPVHHFFPRFATQQRCTAAFIFLACLDVLLLVEKLHIIAAAVLSLGLAKVVTDVIFAKTNSRAAWISRGARWLAGFKNKSNSADSDDEVATSEHELDRRRVLVTAAVAIGAPGIGVSAWLSHQERQRSNRMPASDPSNPNVLLLVMDSVRARNLGLYGYERQTTPHLERFAASGACFDWAIAPAPWTLPSHASMFTGRHAHELNCSWQTPLDNRFVTLAEALTKRGYATSGFVANTQYCARNWGVGRGFNHYQDVFPNLERLMMSSNLARTVLANEKYRRITGSIDYCGRTYAPTVNHQLLKWLDNNQHKPFFAFANYFDAHFPYVPPAPFDSKFAAKRPRSSLPFNFRAEADAGAEMKTRWLSDDEITIERDAYDGCLAYLDNEIGNLFGELSRRGVLDNTLVIVVGDHGEEFAEHNGIMAHAGSLYLPSLHVPLIMSMPGRMPQNARIQAPVSLTDLPHTIMNMIDPTAQNEFPGESWANHFSQGSANPLSAKPLISSTSQLVRRPSWYPASHGDLQSVCLGSHHCIINSDETAEVYDYMADPLESNNMADSAEGREVVADSRKLLRCSGRSG